MPWGHLGPEVWAHRGGSWQLALITFSTLWNSKHDALWSQLSHAFNPARTHISTLTYSSKLHNLDTKPGEDTNICSIFDRRRREGFIMGQHGKRATSSGNIVEHQVHGGRVNCNCTHEMQSKWVGVIIFSYVNSGWYQKTISCYCKINIVFLFIIDVVVAV